MSTNLSAVTEVAHCSTCGGDRNHSVLYSESRRVEEDYFNGGTDYKLLKCCGCNRIQLMDRTWCLDWTDEHGKVSPVDHYYPPASFRNRPEWWGQLMLYADISINTTLGEVYVALQNDLLSLAAMGVRALLEKVMIDKVGDQGSFAKNLSEFEVRGHVSKVQRERLGTILDAGHAAIHRMYRPSQEDLTYLIDFAEHVIESVYIHGSRVDALKTRIPPRP